MTYAALAQAVAHLIGSEEVSGSSPESSLKPEVLIYHHFRLFLFLEFFDFCDQSALKIKISQQFVDSLSISSVRA